ncbi:hypothetical protein [Pseudomonas gingeri]|uniref:hypothetical protein n=1 Tax=Pseudomonas gingeri TaxID=117681 RepID=UPI0015A0C02D|nr:hypothetical protein [Pseudomonas gingeri]NVZ99424.1 hypothetical protein [Pseudomonas gingeri]NWA13469.1 hypothetical protein [Pseudomonas gingeri]NWA55730.1 hypothetical protein [Pseudomonas gingeri]NWA95416.1 hypothetical protein [Pseudomonas gingeri]NWB00503.1 hypothetical protein [Pseudomonas gingeri]
MLFPKNLLLGTALFSLLLGSGSLLAAQETFSYLADFAGHINFDATAEFRDAAHQSIRQNYRGPLDFAEDGQRIRP